MTPEEIIGGYDEVLDHMDGYLDEVIAKSEALSVLSDKMNDINHDIPRNSLLDIRQKINSIKAKSARSDKLIKSCIDWANNAILVRLEAEELDNFSRHGKMFYGSVQSYFSVADRMALEQFVRDSGSLEIFGNTLNKEYVLGVIESTDDTPAGVNVFRKTRLNVRTKQ